MVEWKQLYRSQDIVSLGLVGVPARYAFLPFDSQCHGRLTQPLLQPAE